MHAIRLALTRCQPHITHTGLAQKLSHTAKQATARHGGEVQKKLRAAQTANDASQLPTTTKTTGAEYVKFWIENISRAAVSTKDRYQADIRKHINPVCGKVHLQQLTGMHIDSVLSKARSIELSPRSQQHISRALSKSQNDTVKRDLIGFKHRGQMMMDGHPTSGENLVFCNHAGNIINRNNLVSRTFKPLCAKAGVPVLVWHEMRHTTATLLLESGIPINNVSELLGHASSVVTSRIYAHATKTGMARVTAATASLFQPIEPEPQ